MNPMTEQPPRKFSGTLLHADEQILFGISLNSEEAMLYRIEITIKYFKT